MSENNATTLNRDIVCVVCPSGCRLRVTIKTDGTIDVTGNLCPRGAAHGREETLEPRRTVTAVVAVNSEKLARIPVKTDKPLPFDKIPHLLAELYRSRATLPVRRGDIFTRGVQGTDVNVVFTRSLDR